MEDDKMFFYKDNYNKGKFFFKTPKKPKIKKDPPVENIDENIKINEENEITLSEEVTRDKRSISSFNLDADKNSLLSVPISIVEYRRDMNFPTIVTPTESLSDLENTTMTKSYQDMKYGEKGNKANNFRKSSIAISEPRILNAPSFSKNPESQLEMISEINSVENTNEEGEIDGDVAGMRQISPEEDRAAKKLIRDLFVYILFVICASVIDFSMSSRSAVYFTNTMASAFMETPFCRPQNFAQTLPTEDEKNLNTSENVFRAESEGGVAGGNPETCLTQTLKKSKTIDDFWDFAESTFLNMLYSESWYSKENSALPTTNDDQLIFYSSKLLGVARIRQLRVKKDSCEVHSQASYLFNSCYGYYQYNEEDSSPIPNINPVHYTGTGWRHSKIKNTLSYYGKFSTYSGDGYFVDMSLNKTISQLRIQELKNNIWIDRGTRAIIIDLTVYNTNVNLFVVAKIAIEFPPTGGIYSTGEFDTLKFLRYVSDQDFVVLGFEFSFIFFILYYIFTTILLIKNIGTKYFMNVWNILDIFIILFGFAVIIGGIYRYFMVEMKVIELMKIREEHPTFDNPRYFQIFFNHLSTIVLLFIWIKLFKFLKFNQTINELNKTLARSAKGILSFTIMFCILFLAFAQFAYLTFGTEVEDYRTVWSSAMSLLQAILGKLNYRELEESNYILAPVFLILFVFFIFFVLMNMFGAIIIESYKIVRSQVAPAKERIVGTYLTKLFTNVLTGSKSNSKDIDKSITYSKIRDGLLRAGFTEVEIDVFFAKYNINPDFDATSQEAKKLIAKLELRKFDFDPVDLNAQTLAVLQKKFEKMKSYVEELERKVEVHNQQLKAHYVEHSKVSSTQTPAWTSF